MVRLASRVSGRGRLEPAADLWIKSLRGPACHVFLDYNNYQQTVPRASFIPPRIVNAGTLIAVNVDGLHQMLQETVQVFRSAFVGIIVTSVGSD